MNDTLFRRGLVALTVAVVLFLISSLIFGWLGVFWTLLTSVLLEVVGGGALVYFWGKSYMSRT
jgi:hypothetical protein